MYSSFGPTMPNFGLMTTNSFVYWGRSVIFSSLRILFFNPVTKFSSLLFHIKRQMREGGGGGGGGGGGRASLTKSMAYITEVRPLFFFSTITDMINKKLDLIIKDLSLSTKMSQELMSKADDTQLTDEVFMIYGITKAEVSIRVLTLILIIPDITKLNPIL